ncbi:MAG: hypothetical protein LLG14_19615 [Nocardiaceae bacterium]|nr:hypothetical protein [Nocardiaceae bacterium]
MTAQLALVESPFSDRFWLWISVCGRRTRSGSTCTIRVRFAGDACYHHDSKGTS